MAMNQICSDLFSDNQTKIVILNQPASVYRMRYLKDIRKTNLYAESIHDSDSDSDGTECSESSGKTTKEKKRKFIKVQIVNLEQPAILNVCCVTSEQPYLIHPNLLVGKNCHNGIARYQVDKNNNIVELAEIRIQLIKKTEIKRRVECLIESKIDPFRNGINFDSLSKIDLGKLRLCFYLYSLDPLSTNIEFNRFNLNNPVISNIISTSKQKLSIVVKLKFNMSGPASGDTNIILLVQKLEKDQKPIYAKFFDQNDNWFVNVLVDNIHYRNTIIVKSPAYKCQNIKSDRKVSLKLFVPVKCESSNEIDIKREKYESQTFEFVYTPNFNHDLSLDDFEDSTFLLNTFNM